jgi:hypothetical protein
MRRPSALRCRSCLLGSATRCAQTPDSTKCLQALLDAVQLATTPPYVVNLWRTQNTFYELQQTIYRDQVQRSQKSSTDTMRTIKWLRLFAQLGDKLAIRPPPGL